MMAIKRPEQDTAEATEEKTAEATSAAADASSDAGAPVASAAARRKQPTIKNTFAGMSKQQRDALTERFSYWRTVVYDWDSIPGAHGLNYPDARKRAMEAAANNVCVILDQYLA